MVAAKSSKTKPRAPASEKKKSLFQRLAVPVTVITTVIASVIGIIEFAQKQQAPAYLETNAQIVTHVTRSAGIGAVTPSYYFASLERINGKLSGRKNGARANATDRQDLAEAQAAFSGGRYDDARQGYEQIQGKFPDVPEIRINLSVTLQLLGDSDGARATLDELISHPASLDTVSRRAIDANLAQLFVAQGDSASANPAIRRVLSASASDPVASNAQGIMAYVRDDYRGAAIAFRRASASGKGLPSQRVNLAAALLDGGQPDQAELVVQELEKSAMQSAETQALAGRILLSRKEFAKANAAFARALAMQPGRADLYYNSAVAYASYAPDSAAQYYKLALRADPTLRSAPRPAESLSLIAPAVDGAGGAHSRSGPSASGEATGPRTRVLTAGNSSSSGVQRGIRLQLTVETRPRTPGPGRQSYAIPGTDVFGTAKRAGSFREFSLSYASVRINADGSVASTDFLNLKTGNSEFESGVKNWLMHHKLKSFSSDYEARVEAIVLGN